MLLKLPPLVKGGPGSGHHGHSGRPGQRGGSGGGGVAFGRGATELRQANTVKTLAKLPRSHTAHVKEIEFLTYDELAKKRGGAVATAMGNHHADEGGSEIELKVPPNDSEVFAGNLTSPTQQSMLTHEVGHSVHSLINPSGYGLDGGDARLVKSAKRVFGSEDRSALSSRVDELYGSKDRQALNDYAEASTAEYFSESYSHYAHFPQLLKSRDPAMHDFMRDEIFGE